MLLQVDCEKGEGIDLAKKYKIRGYPTFYLVNQKEEPLFVFMGYSKEYWSNQMEIALSDMEPIPAKMKKFEANPTPELAKMLADYFEAQNDLQNAYAYLKKGKKFAKNSTVDLNKKIFEVVYSGFRSEQFPLDTLKSIASELKSQLTKPKDKAYFYFRMALLLPKVPEDTELQGYLKELVKQLKDQPDLMSDRAKAEAEILNCLFVLKDWKQAVSRKKASLPEGWQENPEQLNSFAWWCFENKINLDEAEALARKAVELSEDPKDKANILDTLAEILSLKGKHKEAILTEEEAIKLNPERKLFKKNLERFKEKAKS